METHPQTTQTVAKAISYCLQTDDKVVLLNTKPTQLTEHKVGLVPTYSLHPYLLLFRLLERTLHAKKEER